MINQEALYQYAANHGISLKVAEQRIAKDKARRDEAIRKMFAKRNAK